MLLTTFGGGNHNTHSTNTTGSNIVRRNKKGKQAPAPPKRTSSFRDSQCDLDAEGQGYSLEDEFSGDVQFIRRRENASFERLEDFNDPDYADMSGADADDDSDVSDTAQSVPEMRTTKEHRERHVVSKSKASKSRTYPMKDHANSSKGTSNSQARTQVPNVVLQLFEIIFYRHYLS